MAITLNTDSTLNGESAEVTVFEDTSGDGSADNQESVTINDGTDSNTLSGISGEASNDYWARLDLSTSDTSTTPRVHSLELTGLVSEKAVSTSLAGAGSLVVAPARERMAAGSISGTGSITATAAKEKDASVALTANGSISASRQRQKTSAANLSGFASLSATATAELAASAPLSGVGTLTADLGHRDWQIGGVSVYPLLDEVRTWQDLDLALRVDEAMRAQALAGIDEGAGKFDVETYPDGSYEVVDRSGGEATVTVTPPATHDILRSTTDYAVADYSERAVDRKINAWEAKLSLTALDPKVGGAHGTTSQGTGEWHFAFADGEISTNRVEADTDRGGETVTGAQSLLVVCTEAEAAVIEESLNRQAATRIRPIADAKDVVEDINANNRNTVTVSTPSNRDPNDDTIAAGTYVVDGFETTLLNDDFFEIALDLLPA